MIPRQEFKDKLTKELLNIGKLQFTHFNLIKFVFERHQGRAVFQLLRKSVLQAYITEHK